MRNCGIIGRNLLFFTFVFRFHGTLFSLLCRYQFTDVDASALPLSMPCGRTVSQLPRSSLSIAHLFNHPPEGTAPLALSFALDLPDNFPRELGLHVPNRYYQMPNLMYLQGRCSMRAVVMVSTGHVRDEEVFLKYAPGVLSASFVISVQGAESHAFLVIATTPTCPRRCRAGTSTSTGKRRSAFGQSERRLATLLAMYALDFSLGTNQNTMHNTSDEYNI